MCTKYTFRDSSAFSNLQQVWNGFYLTWNNMFGTDHSLPVIAAEGGPTFLGYDLFRWKAAYVKLKFNDRAIVWTKKDQEYLPPNEKFTAAQALGTPGCTILLPNAANLHVQAGMPGGSFKGRKAVWKPTTTNLCGWNELTGQNTEQAWQIAPLLRVDWCLFDMERDDLTYQRSGTTGSDDIGYVTFQIWLYYQVGNWMSSSGMQSSVTRSLGALERNRNYISTEVQMHRDGSVKSIDLTGLVDDSDDNDVIDLTQ